MEFNLDYLLDKTAEYLDTIDVRAYLDRGKTDVQIVADRLVTDIENGTLPPLPEDLEGNLFKAFDLWDLAVYIRKRYDLQTEEECVWRYWITPKE